ncbi:hypothetical protein C8J57DRAFT_1257845 [Mycena rebaudengoi]|nr:hypothetical protein C8J57DRAFT_1257845 [Mycena rebaudengoi]
MSRSPKGETLKPRLGHANAKGFIYTKLKGTKLLIETEVSLGAQCSAIPAVNMGLAHISTRVKKLPYLAFERMFTVQPSVIHDCVVVIRRHWFLISGHYSKDALINGALKEIAPTFDWKEEIIVVQLGQRVDYV